MDLSQYTDEELKQIAGSGKTDGVSSMSDEELMKIAGVDLPKREESTLGKVLNNSVVRGTVSGMQKMLDAWYNPVGQIAKGLNYSFGDGKWELPESLKPDITPRNATERAISNTLDYGQDALAFLGGGEALKSLGVLGKGVSKASKIARGIASGSVGDALASSAGAGTLTGIVNPQTWYGNLLTGVGGAVAGGGLLSGARAAKNAWNVRQGGKELQKQVVDRYVSPDGEYMPILKSIRRNMEKTNPEFKMATKDGKIDYAHFLKDSQRRGYIGTLPSTYKNPNEAFSGINNGQPRNYLYKQYQNAKNGKDVHDLLIKSEDGTLINKFAREGRSGEKYVNRLKNGLERTSANGPSLRQTQMGSTPLSDLRHDYNVAQNATNVKENNFINALADTNKTRRLKNAVQAGERGIQEQADDLLNRMVARQNGAYDEALEKAIKTPKMIQADAKYNRFITQNGGERLSKKAVNEFYSENPIASGLIEEARVVDPQSFRGVSRGSLKEFDMLKRMLRKMKGNQAEKTVSQTAAENAEKAVKKLMDDSFKGFREVNKEYAAASLAQDLFEKKVFNNVRNLSKASTSPFWSVLASSAAGAGTFGALAHNPASLALGIGALGGKAALRGLRRQAGRAIIEGKTPIYDATISAILNGATNTGKATLKYGKYPAISTILNKKGE